MIQHTVEDKLSAEILEGKISFKDKITMKVKDDEIVFEKEGKPDDSGEKEVEKAE